MKKHLFMNNEPNQNDVLTHADFDAIMDNAIRAGEFKKGYSEFITASEEGLQESIMDQLSHKFDEASTEMLFPEYKNLNPGAPELLINDQKWVTNIMNRVHKSPYARLKTRTADAREFLNEAKGYKTGDEKTLMALTKLIQRTTDPQTIYVKDAIDRDVILDITDFDVVQYQYNFMRILLNETIATAALIGDSREDIDPDKIKEEHIRPIWLDGDVYVERVTVDYDAMAATLQGTDTSKYFGDGFIYSEAVIEAVMNAKNEYRGSGDMDFYCTPTMLTKLLLARDRNGKRMYDTIASLTTALEVNAIFTTTSLNNKIREADGKKMKLLGIFVNMNDYVFGAVAGGKITKFNQFDIDYNREKMLMETRLCGALTKVKSAIILEEDVTAQG